MLSLCTNNNLFAVRCINKRGETLSCKRHECNSVKMICIKQTPDEALQSSYIFQGRAPAIWW